MKRTITINKWLFILAIGVIGCSTDELPKVEEATLDGKYTGSWSSITPTATFTSVPISAILVLSGPTNLSGDFFVSSSFVSCCNSGSNDGTINMVIDEKVITSFTYTDNVKDCTGFISGQGIIKDDGSFLITFTGRDCDGQHSDGVLILSKK